MGLIALFKAGGFTMYPLLLCSIAIWGIIFEKLWFLSKFRREFLGLHDEAFKLLKLKKVEEVRGLYKNASVLIARPNLALLDEEELSKDLREAKVRRRLTESYVGLKQYMWVLGTIGAAAPFIGLFGTVTGIIRSFDAIAASGKSGFSVVAGGLSEALITTAAGILIAVVAVLFYNYLQVKINNLNLDFKNKLEDLSDLL